MSRKPLNSVQGFSTGEVPITVIDANANITVTGLSANGNAVFSGANVDLGSVSNLHISGGTSGYFLKTNGSGTLSWDSAGSNVTPGGNSTDIQFNNSGSLGGSDNFTFNNTSNTVSVNGVLELIDSSPLHFASASGNYVAFQAPTTIGSNVTWNLPNVVGTNGQLLASDGTGNLFWDTLPTGNIKVGTRTGTVPITLYNGNLIVEGRSGNIPVPITS